MSVPRLHVAPWRSAAQVPLSPSAVAIRANLEMRCQQLEELSPEALDLAAEILAALHEGLHGRATELRGTKSPRYRRAQLLGASSLAIEGVCYLALMAPREVAAALQVLAAACGYALQPLSDAPRPVADATAATVEAAADVAAKVTMALADRESPGRVDQAEAAWVADALSELERHASDLRAVIERVRLGQR